jgi:hypothetical protein
VVAYLGVEASRSVLEGLRSAALPEGSAAALVLNRDLYPRDEFRSP